MEIVKEDKKNLDKIVTALKNGKVLVCPTDTVYGFICDINNKEALEKIFSIKQRDKNKPLLVFVDSIEVAKKITEISESQERFLKNVWPGQVTAILKSKGNQSPLICKDMTIGVRIPKHDFLNLILKEFGKSVAQTSANISGAGATTEVKNIIDQFKGKKNQPDIIINAGDLPNREPSIIIDITDNKIKTLRR